MRASAHRALSWMVVLTLTLGFLGATTSALAASGDCAVRGDNQMQGMPPCQWMIPAACCDQPSSVSSATTVVPKPSISIGFLAPLDSEATPAWTPVHASWSPQRVLPSDVVLRL